MGVIILLVKVVKCMFEIRKIELPNWRQEFMINS